jgi:hypothetical protein
MFLNSVHAACSVAGDTSCLGSSVCDKGLVEAVSGLLGICLPK